MTSHSTFITSPMTSEDLKNMIELLEETIKQATRMVDILKGAIDDASATLVTLKNDTSESLTVTISDSTRLVQISAPATPICWGCKEDQPNQLAHMDYGGCLYEEQ